MISVDLGLRWCAWSHFAAQMFLESTIPKKPALVVPTLVATADVLTNP